ncbi:MAG: NBR1-Ig-like domain-containing protein [Chloroflexota bacterium]
MKTYRTLIIVLLALAFGACGNATPTPTGEDAMHDVYTAAAMTFTAQANLTTAQSTPTPVPLPTSFASPTLFSSATTFPTSTSYSSSASVGCYASAYVSDVTIADGTEIAPGESFTKTWELKNTGTCEWEDDYLLIFYSGQKMNGENAAIGESVASGSVVEVSVTLTAPDTDGTYTGYWSLANSSGAAFGSTFYVQIVVSSDLTTSTPTSTSTDSSTSTSTPTTAPSSTPSPIPSETPIPTPVSVSPNLAPEVGRVGTKLSEG